MRQRLLDDTDLTISALCYGTVQFGDMPCEESDRLMDIYRDAGGNFFDTAHCYCFWLPSGAGSSERVLGDYVRRRGCRQEVVLATKGAHPPTSNYRPIEQYMSMECIRADIGESLSRMQIETIDLFWLHRDDTRVPVGEIIGILNAEVQRGRIRSFGGSNWTTARLDEANAYARAHGLMGFVANQPRWNLACEADDPTGAERLKPDAMLALSDTDAQWHTQSQMAVIPYSSTANGFFATGGESPVSYRTARGLARLAAVKALAVELELTPNQIALAWLLSQPFPVFPIIGTGNPNHLKDALGAVDVVLSPSQVRQLTAIP